MYKKMSNLCFVMAIMFSIEYLPKRFGNRVVERPILLNIEMLTDLLLLKRLKRKKVFIDFILNTFLYLRLSWDRHNTENLAILGYDEINIK